MTTYSEGGKEAGLRGGRAELRCGYLAATTASGEKDYRAQIFMERQTNGLFFMPTN
jgi:hypothetical protein